MTRPFVPPAHRLAQLRAHGIPAAFIEPMLGGTLAEALARTMPFGAVELSDVPVALCGPPGAGKTLTTAKLATRLVLAGQLPCVITTDGSRAAASEQLAAYTRLLGLRLMVATTPEALAQALRRRTPGAPVLIDTAGAIADDPPEARALGCLLEAASARPLAVLPAGMDPAECADTAAAFATLGARALIATRLDAARRLGGIVAAAAKNLALVELGLSPNAATGLSPATPDLFAERIARGPGAAQEAA